MKRGAFTLIEVLVTVAIIALLISIAAPSISEARRLSKRSTCLHGLHQIGVGIEAYLNVHKDIFPFLARMPSIEAAVAASAGRPPFVPMPTGLKRELGDKSKVFECPADIVTELPAAGSTAIVSPTLRIGGRYYDSEGTSYEWTSQVNGLHRHTKKVMWNDLVPMPMKDLPLVFDFEPFHGGKKRMGSLNTLYADLHVQSDKAR